MSVTVSLKDLVVDVLSIEPPRILIKWDLADTLQDVSRVQFYVDRGESPSSILPITATPVPGGTRYEYVDYSANLMDLNKTYYYAVRAVDKTSGKELARAETSTIGELDLVGLYVVEENLYLHRWVHGVPVFFYQRRKDGGNCDECWDSVLKRVTKSNCRTCLGTGRTGGFYPPIECWVSIAPNITNEQIADWGKIQPNQTQMQLTNYPIVNEGDVIFEAASGLIWRLGAVSYPEKNRVVILQTAALEAVNPSDIEYRLQPPDDRKLALISELMYRTREREF